MNDEAERIAVRPPDVDGHCGHCHPWDCFSHDPQRHTNGLGVFWDEGRCPLTHKEADQ